MGCKNVLNRGSALLYRYKKCVWCGVVWGTPAQWGDGAARQATACTACNSSHLRTNSINFSSISEEKPVSIRCKHILETYWTRRWTVHSIRIEQVQIGSDQWRTEGGVFGGSTPPRNSEGPPKSCKTQPDCENC